MILSLFVYESCIADLLGFLNEKKLRELLVKLSSNLIAEGRYVLVIFSYY